MIVLSDDSPGGGNQFGGNVSPSKIVAIGSGDISGEGSNTLIYVKKSSSGYGWYSYSYLAESPALFATFGKRSESLIVGCHTNYRLVPSAAGLTTKNPYMRLSTEEGEVQFRLPKQSSSILCGSPVAGESAIYDVINKGVKSKVVTYSAAGERISDTATFPSTWTKGQKFTVPATETQVETVGFIVKIGSTQKMYIYSVGLGDWVQFPLPEQVAHGIVKSVSAFYITETERWVSVLLSNGNIVTFSLD